MARTKEAFVINLKRNKLDLADWVVILIAIGCFVMAANYAFRSCDPEARGSRPVKPAFWKEHIRQLNTAVDSLEVATERLATQIKRLQAERDLLRHQLDLCQRKCPPGDTEAGEPR